MTDNEFLLQDRIQKIQQIINQYGEENFYISFSGGKDSAALSKLVDMALPDNNIPRVYADTGIELNMIRQFVYDMSEWDWRIEIIKPTQNIKDILEFYGYPFKSKEHSLYVDQFQRHGKQSAYYKRYLFPQESRKSYACPKKLRYQFTDEFSLNISKKCCDMLKIAPLNNFERERNKPYAITGIMRSEGGARNNAHCLVFRGKKFVKFHPMSILTKEWEEWFIESYNVEICDIYKEPYNFPRTGCKGCPYIINLQEELDILQKYFPAERKQCEIIWKPVYDEYRRIGYRLKDKYNA